MSFLTDVEAQAKAESERVIKELTQLKFDAQQVIHVLNALKLEVPKELRELSPIEVVPAPLVSTPSTTPALRKARARKGGLVAAKSRKVKAAEREKEIRKAITDQLSKGPVFGGKVMDNIPHTNSKISDVAARMRKEGLLDYRVVGFQGSTEWFLPSRPITLEQVRDAALEVRKKGLVYDTEVNPIDVAQKLNIDRSVATDLMEELVDQGILTRPAASDIYTYEKPKADPFSIPHAERKKNFSGGVNGVSGDKISSDKMVRELVARIKNQGAQVKKTGSHISVSFAGHHTIIGSTPNAGGFKQDREKLKKMGLRV